MTEALAVLQNSKIDAYTFEALRSVHCTVDTAKYCQITNLNGKKIEDQSEDPGGD